jgi:hypothetical protein
VPFIFAKEFHLNSKFKEYVISKSHKKMDESRFNKTLDLLHTYTVKKLKTVVNYPHFFGLLSIYREAIGRGDHSSKSKFVTIENLDEM